MHCWWTNYCGIRVHGILTADSLGADNVITVHVAATSHRMANIAAKLYTYTVYGTHVQWVCTALASCNGGSQLRAGLCYMAILVGIGISHVTSK